MPSPIAHLSAGLLTYSVLRQKNLITVRPRWSQNLLPLGGCLVAAMLPDIDAAIGILRGNLGAYHNQYTHSLMFCAASGAAVWGALRLFRSAQAARWGLIAGLSCLLHVFMDWMTAGRGVKLFWPFLQDRYLSPMPVFFGLKWSDGLVSSRHWYTLLNEVSLLVAVLVIRFLWSSGRRKERTDG